MKNYSRINKELNLPEHWDLMSQVRQDGETFEHYKERLKLIKVAEKIYKHGERYEHRN